LINICSPNQARLPTALALGSFDGLHAGHRKVINEITTVSSAIPTLVSFWPHPREVLYKESRLRLDLPSEKTSLLEELGIQQFVLVPFDNSLAALSAEEFFNKILLGVLKARKIAVGQNFRFGKNREGDPFLMKEFALKNNVEIAIVPILEDKCGRVSSSRIRFSLSEGDLKTARNLLGRPYNFRGIVRKGKGLGLKIGWPTANLEVNGRKFLPGIGVYAAWAEINNEKERFPAVMNLGPQPTIDPKAPSAVEVHLLDKKVELNNKELIIEPIKRIRGQKKFQDLKSLSKQIGLDADLARSIINEL